ncbi:hypothetical protein [Nocardia sp. NPDC057440]|uniref:hypothetical protein n=1 Tax=Nocardia sp. NPDC057440 TaxID=3346134 RepID=UPI0036720971
MSGQKIEGCDAYVSGPKRSRVILDVTDIALGTGARPAEVLAIRWCDLDLAAPVPLATISGTVTRDSEKGLHRQEFTKTEAGYRVLKLPKFAVTTLLRLKLEATPNDLDLVFPDRKGNVRCPHNFRRTWRQARGTTFDWITVKTSRSTTTITPALKPCLTWMILRVS